MTTVSNPRRETGTILVILPAFNEGRVISEVIAGLQAHGLQVLVVDDGSADDTSERARAAGAEVVRLEPNQGKGVALETGFDYARAHGFEAVVTMDADGQHSPDDVPGLVEAYRRLNVPVLIGNRMSDTSTMPPVRKWTNRLMSYLLSGVMGQSVPDTQNGFRLYRLDAIENMELDSARFAAESEILLHIARRGTPIGTAPVQTIYGTERSKINPMKDTFRFVRMLLRFRREMRAARRSRSG